MATNSELNIHHLVICANMLVRKDGKYLMLRRSPLKKVSPNVLHMVGGKIDDSEQPFKAAERELMEETGLTVDDIRLECVVTEVIPAEHEVFKNNWLVYYFSGDYKSGELKQTDEGELVWMTVEEIKKGNLLPSVRETIDLQLDPSVGTVFAKFVYDKDLNVLEREIDVCAK